MYGTFHFIWFHIVSIHLKIHQLKWNLPNSSITLQQTNPSCLYPTYSTTRASRHKTEINPRSTVKQSYLQTAFPPTPLRRTQPTCKLLNQFRRNSSDSSVEIQSPPGILLITYIGLTIIIGIIYLITFSLILQSNRIKIHSLLQPRDTLKSYNMDWGGSFKH